MCLCAATAPKLVLVPVRARTCAGRGPQHRQLVRVVQGKRLQEVHRQGSSTCTFYQMQATGCMQTIPWA